MQRFVTNLIIFSCLWILISEGRADSWIVGGPVVMLAAVAAVLLATDHDWRLSLIGFLYFSVYFIRSSFLGGLDIARRSLHRRLPINPQLIKYNLRLPSGTPRVFFMNVVNLLPGTVSADVRDSELLVHVIDGTQPIIQELEKLEHLVANLFVTKSKINWNAEGNTP